LFLSVAAAYILPPFYRYAQAGAALFSPIDNAKPYLSLDAKAPPLSYSKKALYEI
jgi:hypothetical protein